MTIVYNAYYKAYNNGTLNLNDVHFGAKIVGCQYNPRLNDNLNDIVDVTLDLPVGLKDDIMLRKGMSEIMDKIRNRLRAHVNRADAMEVDVLSMDNTIREALNSDDPKALKKSGVKWIVVYSKDLNILCFTEEI